MILNISNLAFKKIKILIYFIILLKNKTDYKYLNIFNKPEITTEWSWSVKFINEN